MQWSSLLFEFPTHARTDVCKLHSAVGPGSNETPPILAARSSFQDCTNTSAHNRCLLLFSCVNKLLIRLFTSFLQNRLLKSKFLNSIQCITTVRCFNTLSYKCDKYCTDIRYSIHLGMFSELYSCCSTIC